ncbi:MAG: amidohydrolase family protein, partial [Actinobacteria bacterium]|nr:amidohydrolase family protein [Actinomycetota bacterium]
MSDVVVRGGVVVLAEGAEQLDVVARDGVVVALTPPGTVDTVGVEVVDADGLLVFPGVVDAHVHFDDPGRAEWEGFDHGSAAAAAGGVTTVVDMPIDSDPPTVTADALRAKAAAAEQRSRVDVALWAGLTPHSVGDLAAMAEAGAVGFKAFACPSGWDD